MDVFEAIRKRRTIRRFQQRRIPKETLRRLVEAARVAPSAANLQPLEYIIVYEEKKCEELFQNLRWAGYVEPRRNPGEGEKPTAYIVVLSSTEIAKGFSQSDAGAAIENILLAALEEGIGTCWIGSVEREKVKAILGIPAGYKIDSVIALGYPAEEPVLEEMRDSIKYWLDEKDVLHIPKRRLKDILHENKF